MEADFSWLHQIQWHIQHRLVTSCIHTLRLSMLHLQP